MKKKISFFLLIIMLAGSGFCCNNVKNQKTATSGETSDCSERLKRSTELVRNAAIYEDSARLDSALALLNNVTQCDEKLKGRIYFTKASILVQLHNYRGALDLADTVLSSNANNTYYLMLKAEMFKKLSKSDSSQVYYQRCYDIVDSLLTKKPSDITLMLDKVNLIYEIKNRDEAIKQINKFIGQYPDNEVLQVQKEQLMDFTTVPVKK